MVVVICLVSRGVQNDSSVVMVIHDGAGIAQLVVCWASLPCMIQHHRFNPPASLPVEGIFPLELTWVLTPFPRALSDESVN